MEKLRAVHNEYLEDLQQQFANVLGVEPGLLTGLRLCSDCGGYDYRWTDITCTDLAEEGFLPDGDEDPDDFYDDYRAYIAESMCKPCDGTGFEHGSFDLTTEQWLALGEIHN